VKFAAIAPTVALTVLCSGPASAHDLFTEQYAPAGFAQDLEMRVSHGCMGSPLKALKVKIPEGIVRVTVEYVRDWHVELKMRTLPKPVPFEGGRPITEVVDEITWKDPPSPMPGSLMYEGFHFRVLLPDTPGATLFFRTVNICEKGDDRYVDLPAESLTASTPGLAAKLGKFMTATTTPAPFIVLVKPSRPEYPWIAPSESKPPAAMRYRRLTPAAAWGQDGPWRWQALD
jgi:uncharacterized protein YcnI